jgi:hypothetical protein
VPRAKLAYDKVGDDGDGMAVQLSRPALRLLLGPAGVVAWRRESIPHASWWRRPHPGVVPHVVAHAPVGVGGARAGQRLLVRGGKLSCEAETSRARRRLVGGGPSGRELVGDAPNWSGTRRLTSEGLDRGPGSSSS